MIKRCSEQLNVIEEGCARFKTFFLRLNFTFSKIFCFEQSLEVVLNIKISMLPVLFNFQVILLPFKSILISER